jgi:hypothetical protein
MNLFPTLTPISESALFPADCQPLPGRTAVQSRSLAGIAYNPNQAILQVEFRDGTVYQYFQVPRQTYQGLLQADSKGTYFNRLIRNVFRCARLKVR